MILLALAAAASLQTADSAPGRYTISGAGAPCTLTLQPSSAQPPESDVAADSAAGFVIATPTCPEALRDAVLWRISLTDGVLLLVDGAGDSAFTGQMDENDWIGTTRDRATLLLVRQ